MTKNIVYIILTRKTRICNVSWIKPINVHVEDNLTDFFFTRSLCVVHACHTAAFERDPKKKEEKSSRVIACKHIRRSRWFRDRCARSYFGRALPCSCDATRAALPKRRARRSISLLRGIHSTREIAPPRTKRNGLRRFYYTALKPGRLPLQSYTDRNWRPLYNADSGSLQKFGALVVILIFCDIEKSSSLTQCVLFSALFENHIEKLPCLKIVHDL